MNIKGQLTSEDWHQFYNEALRYFVLPVVLIFLITLQAKTITLGGTFITLDSFVVALIAATYAAYATGISMLINLLTKYTSGIDPKEFPTGTKTVIESTPDEFVKTQVPSNEVLSDDKTGEPIVPIIIDKEEVAPKNP